MANRIPPIIKKVIIEKLNLGETVTEISEELSICRFHVASVALSARPHADRDRFRPKAAKSKVKLSLEPPLLDNRYGA